MWDERDIDELLRTVLNDWPCATVLLSPVSDVAGKWALTALEGGPTVEGPPYSRVQTVVLDGQQRLTSLYQAVTNNTEKLVFFVDMGRLRHRATFDDECVAWKKREDFPNEQKG